ncbi:hypothetical protein IHQ68_19970 [Chelatococcus sambhunathii]|uniref:Uncharacterized protein n=1 Tax=Chelatococcus sambhunathii TaxID=363953 RepID=A0ABU1DL86_9HYPH|nr:hypothetical protein [Chelatococcus sambhunathii]MDR4308906.1 hypothetical protein [Chelatococcus sambhunathii]
MFGLDTLDVSIGVILFFLQVSLLCSTIREGVETFSKARAGDLERGLREMLDDPKGLTIVRSLFEHAQLSSLFPGDYDPGRLKSKRDGPGVMPRSARASLPSYIPAGQFAVALMDIVARGRGDWPYPVDPAPMTVDLLRQRAATLPSGKLQRAMLSAIDHGENDLGKIKANLERWYDGTMDRVSGWYKRRTQIWLLGIGLGRGLISSEPQSC